jgi:hypothetical protein
MLLGVGSDYGNLKQLWISNFAYHDDGQTIDVTYRTHVDAVNKPNIKKRWQKFSLYGKPTNSNDTPDKKPIFHIRMFCSNSPYNLDYTIELGNIVLDENGYGEICLDELGIWAGFEINESSTLGWELEGWGIDVVDHTER